jgi:hypothetical protein
MKPIINKLFFVVGALVLIASCKKDEVKAVLQKPSTTTLTASATTLVLDSANKSNTAITFSWPEFDYGYSADVTYTLQFDSTADNFAKPYEVLIGVNTVEKSYIVSDFNSLLSETLQLPVGVASNLLVRIKADVKQYNGAASTVPSVYSDTVTLTVTPYSTKPQPKYPVPDVLFIVGDATPGGWNNPVLVPSQQLTKIDDNTFGIVVQLAGGKHYLFLPKNGDWGHKYALNAADNTDPTYRLGGPFQPDNGPDIPAPDADGLYQIVVDFVKATYTVTPATPGAVPANLYIVGDATAGGWNNPVPVPAQQFTQISSAEFEIILPLTSGKSYLFLPVNGSWDHKYGGAEKLGGQLLADNNVPGSNTPAPDESGNYKIDVNFLSKQYTVTKE